MLQRWEGKSGMGQAESLQGRRRVEWTGGGQVGPKVWRRRRGFQVVKDERDELVPLSGIRFCCGESDWH